MTFSGPHKALDIDGTRFTLDYTGDWHQAGNLFIHIPELRTMAAIDSFSVKNPPFFRLVFSPTCPHTSRPWISCWSTTSTPS